MKQSKHSSLDGILALLLFGVFAVCILSVLLTSADTYQRLTERDLSSYDHRTAAQYLVTRIRQSDQQHSVALTEFQGTDILELREEINGSEYVTRIYYWDGYIRELFTAVTSEFYPEDGGKLIAADALHFSWLSADRLLIMELVCADGTAETITLSIRSGEGALS